MLLDDWKTVDAAKLGLLQSYQWPRPGAGSAELEVSADAA